MSHLINDVMDLARSRLGAGFSANIADIPDLDLVLQHVVNELIAVHPKREVVTRFAIGQVIRGGKARLEQLISNLLGMR